MTDHFAVRFASDTPAFASFDIDSLGRGVTPENLVLVAKLPRGEFRLETLRSGNFNYSEARAEKAAKPAWAAEVGSRRITLRSHHIPGQEPTPFLLLIDQRKNHATVLGRPGPARQQIVLPAVLHLPDRGTVRITTNVPGAVLDCDARRRQPEFFVAVRFPAATAACAKIEYTLESTLIHPELPGLAEDSLYDGYRRSFLNLIQFHPRLRTLANNSSSDVCGFCLWQYAELARRAPALAPGLTVMDLVRISLDRVLAGGLTYGQVGYGKSEEQPEAAAWSPPFDSLDTRPSFVIAGAHAILEGRDATWARANFPRFVNYAREMLAADRNQNGLIEYPLSGDSGSWDGTTGTRPANWWDTIGFGHEDAFSNALAYRGCLLLAEAAQHLGRPDEAAEFSSSASRIKAAYYPTFHNPETGVLAGWKSADGRLHDYWFTFINGMAVAFGLVETDAAHALMDRLLAKMSAAGFDRFDLGLPGNLVPIRREDYTDRRRRYGGPEREDGSDAFQIYENGAATHCHAYWLVKALYRLGRIEEARRIFHPMLRSFAAGDFQGFTANGLSKDWRNWKGEGNGYEGYLSDGYLALLAVEDDTAQKGQAVLRHA